MRGGGGGETRLGRQGSAGVGRAKERVIDEEYDQIRYIRVWNAVIKLLYKPI